MAAVQTPLDTVHTNALVPVAKAVTDDEAELTDAIVPAPESRDQAPVPTAGLVAARVADDEQNDWLTPADDVGCTSLTIVTVAADVGQLLLGIVHKKELAPVLNDVTGELGSLTDVTFPEPLNTDHVPVPIAFKVAVETQTV